MSSVVISGDTSGAITLSAPAVAGTNTLTLPAVTGTILTSASTITPSDGSVTQAKLASNVAGNGPAFSAYQSSGTAVSNGTVTKITFDTEEYDTNSCFASSRFTPNVAGYYQVSTMVAWPTGNTANVVYIGVYKNGSANKLLSRMSKDGQYMWLTGSALVYCNGTTDYLEIYGYQDSGLTITTDTGFGYTWFAGSMIRSA